VVVIEVPASGITVGVRQISLSWYGDNSAARSGCSGPSDGAVTRQVLGRRRGHDSRPTHRGVYSVIEGPSTQNAGANSVVVCHTAVPLLIASMNCAGDGVSMSACAESIAFPG